VQILIGGGMDIEQKEQKEQNTQLDWHLIAVMSILLPIIILLGVVFIFLLIPLKKKWIENLQPKLFSNKIWEELRLTSDSLDKQNLFWVAIITPIMYFIIVGIIAWIGTDINFNYQGFNKFLEISKLPLGVLALSPILGVIVSNAHRTIQTKDQIDKTNTQIIEAARKNTNDGYYSHVKYITDEISKISYVISMEKIPSYFLMYLPDFHKTIDETRTIDTELCMKLEIELKIEQPKNFYHYIFQSSNLKNGYSNDINQDFIKKTKDILTNLVYVSACLRHYLIIDDSGNPIDIINCNRNRMEAEYGVKFFNTSKLNQYIPNMNFEIKSTESNVLNTIIERLFGLSGRSLKLDINNKSYEKLLTKRLSYFFAYYGEVIVQYTKFIYHIVSVLELDDDEIFTLISNADENAKRLLKVADFCDEKTNLGNIPNPVENN